MKINTMHEQLQSLSTARTSNCNFSFLCP